MHVPAIVTLLALGFASVWFGLVEDIELTFALAVVCWIAATLMTFSGKPGVIQPPPSKQRAAALTERRARGNPRDMFLPVAVTFGFIVGSVGIWLGLVEDIKFAMFFGLAAWAGAVLATFRGRADVWRS